MNSSTIAHALVNAALQATSVQDSDDFEDILSATRRSFRPNVRGRRRVRSVKRNILLLRRAEVDFVPGSREVNFLNSHGMGTKKNVTIVLQDSIRDLEHKIVSLYPSVPLNLVGFTYFKIRKSRRLEKIQNAVTAEDLIRSIGQGLLVIMPNRDLPIRYSPIDPLSNNNGPSEDIRVRESQINRNNFPSNSTETDNNADNNVPSEIIPQSPIRRVNNLTSNSNLTNETPEAQRRQNHLDANGASGSEMVRHSLPRGEYLPMTTENSLSNNLEPPPETSFDVEMPLNIIFDVPKLSVNAETLDLYINRENCLEEMLKLYEDETVVEKNIYVTFLGEVGADLGGLTKELFNLFWDSAEKLYFIGEDCIVPFLPLHRSGKEKNTFVVLGRILCHMLLITGNIPAKMSRAVYHKLANIAVNPEILLQDFLQHVAPLERNIIQKALNDFSTITKKEYDSLINTFANYSYYEIPKADGMRNQILAIANDVLVEKPASLVEKIKQGVSETQLQYFWRKLDKDIITCILAKQRPTIQKVIECLVSNENLSNDETRVFHYLQNFIQSLDGDNLLQFLFFVTGSYLMPPKIIVEFNCLIGLMRRPLVHTCSNTIELSRCYNSFQEFKRDMMLNLKNELCYQYSQI